MANFRAIEEDSNPLIVSFELVLYYTNVTNVEELKKSF